MTSLVVRSYLPEDREALIALWDRVRPDDPVLVEAAEDGLRDLGCPKVNLQIRAKNAGIADFYRSSGYQVEELVSMIETQRAYEMNSRAISTADQMLQYVSNNL